MSDIVTLQHEIIPQWASFDEATFYVLEDFENNYQQMMREFAFDDLAYVVEKKDLAPDSESKIKKIKDTIVEFIKKQVNRFLAMCNKFLQQAKEKFDSVADKNLNKMTYKIKENIDNLKDKEYGKTYAYPNYYDYIANPQNIKELQAALDLCIDVINTVEEDDLSKMEEKINSAKSKFYTAVHSKQDAKESEVRKGLITWFRCGSSKEQTVTVNKAYIKSAVQDGMLNMVSDYGKISKYVSGVIKEYKKNINTVEKKVKGYKKNNSSVYGVLMPALRFAISMTMVTQSAFMSVIHEKLIKDISLVTRLAMVSSGGKKATNEAATEVVEESSSYQTEIASLFDFSF